MGQFKPMVKMMTTEPSVELKLKKGGHVSMKGKEEHGHKAMHHMMDGGVMGSLAAPRGGMMPAAAPMKPSMAARRAAMMGRPMGRMMKEGGESTKEHMAELREMKDLKKELKHHESQKASKAHHGLKEGGKVHHMSGHPEGSYEHHKAMQKHYAAKCKAGGSAHMHKMHEHHKHMAKMCKGGGYAEGGTIHTPVKPYGKTMMHEAHKDTVHGTGEIKEGKPGGFKRGGHAMSVGGDIPSDTNKSRTPGKIVMGGTIEGNEGPYEETDMHSAAPDRAHGTGGVEEAQGGYKRGGKAHKFAIGGATNWENRPADTAHPGVTHAKTGEVREANAGGFKKGGHAKKSFATGGLVDTGRPVAMPKKPISAPVKNTMQSGTFKRGGKVHYAEGGKLPPGQESRIKQLNNEQAYANYEKERLKEMEEDKNIIPDMVRGAVSGIKRLLNPSSPDAAASAPAGSVTKTERSTTVTPAKKRAGGAC